MTYKVAMILLLCLISNQEGILKCFNGCILLQFLTRYDRSNMTNKLEKECFCFGFQQLFVSYYRKLPEFCDCSKKLNMQSYMICHAAHLLIHVPIKYGRPNMGNKWQNGVFLKF